MELTETIDSINRQLVDLFGVDTITGMAIWRVVWSDDQFEHRYGTYEDYSEGGLFIRSVTEVRYVPKYRQWIRGKYVLERLVVVPEINAQDLPSAKLSYEPMYPFQTNSGEYLPPRLDAAVFVIRTVLAAQGKTSLVMYKDPRSMLSPAELAAYKAQEIQALQDDLFGNETDVGDALAHKEAIVVPRNFKKES